MELKNPIKEYKTTKSLVYSCQYHVIFCTKYRRKVLTGNIAARLKERLFQKAEEIGVTIENLQIMPDHLHMLVKTSPVDSPHYIIQQFKGYTSRILRLEFQSLATRLPTLWTRSYYCESVGNISPETIQRYINKQKNK